MTNDKKSSLDIADKQRLGEITADFVSAWETGERPDLKSFVEQSEFPRSDKLLETLLPIDIANRLDRNTAVSQSDYQWAGDETADVAKSIIVEISSRNQTRSFHDPHESTGFEAGFDVDSGVKPSRTTRSHSDFSPPPELNDYRIVRELGRGGMGAVFEAVHKSLGHSVALKVLPRVEGALLHKFKREFRSLTETNHPNLIGLHTLESDGETWFFTMDLIKNATDFLRYVRPNNQLDEPRLRSALDQLAAGVSALHDLQIIHRDLKPANVMIDGDGKLLILDFGLVAELESRNATITEQQISGTPGYMSPEQARGEKSSPQSDWYAVGVMLYEALGGRRPFDGPTMKVLSDKTRQDAPALQCDDPQDLCNLCMQLLAREPDQRPEPESILKAVVRSEHDKIASAPIEIQSVRLIGREKQLAELAQAFRVFEDDQQSLSVFVSGRSGEGKTILAEQFLAPLMSNDNYAFISGRCYDRESVPFKALDSLIDGLCSYLRRLDERYAALLMPREIGLLARLFPVLNRVDVVARVPTPRLGQLDEQQIRTRAFQALRELLTRISDGRPVIAFVDDLQWGDAESAEAMFEVLRPPSAPLLLFVGTYRSDEAGDSEFLKKWDALMSRTQTGLNQRDVRVHPFSESECVDLFLKMSKTDTPAIRAHALELAKQTGGNPFLISELFESFDASSDSNQPRALAELIEDKLESLDSRAKQLLNVVSVSGQALPLLELASAMGSEPIDITTLTAMRNQRLVRLVGNDVEQKIDTYHDRIRETILKNISQPIKVACHLNLAKAIESSCEGGNLTDIVESTGNPEDLDHGPKKGMERVYDLAYHFDAAGETQLALNYSLLAAEQAERQFSPQVASVQYARANRNAGDADASLRYRIHLGSGKSLRLTGQYDRALDSLDHAVELAVSRFDRAQISGLRAEITHKQGRIGESLKQYSAALRQLRIYVPKTRIGYFFALMYQVGVQTAHTWLPKFVYCRNREPTREESLAMELANRNSIVSYFNDGIRMMWTHLRGMNLAEIRSPSRELAYSHGLHPAPLMALRLSSRGKRYSAAGTQLAESYGDELLLAHCYAMIGLASFSNGDFRASIESCEIACERTRKTGDYYLLLQSEFSLNLCKFRVGKTSEISQSIAEGFNREINFGSSSLASPLLNVACVITNGRLPLEGRLNKFTLDDADYLGMVWSGISKGLRHLDQQQFEEAYQEFNSAWRWTVWRLVTWASPFSSLNFSITALRQWAASLPETESRKSKQLLRNASRSLRVSLLLSRIYIGERAHTLREAGLVDELRGRSTKALKQLNQSLAIAEKLEDLWNRALTLKEIGRIEKLHHVPGAEEKIIEANRYLDQVKADTASIDSLMLR